MQKLTEPLLSIKGRINFLQLARYGIHGEQRYRAQFEKPFDFLCFNKELVLEYAGDHRTIVPSPLIQATSVRAAKPRQEWDGIGRDVPQR